MLATYLAGLNLFVEETAMATATKFVALYWGGALVGRLLGAAVMQKYDPKKMLAIFGACATLMVALTIICAGFAPYVSLITIVLVGFFNSIMFPTIFSLAIAGLGDKTSQGSALLNMAIVGGAIVPLLMGVASDKISIAACFLIPLVCYAYITFFGLKGAKTD
jgi:FHS family L-fucose permease-like MFS transporter